MKNFCLSVIIFSLSLPSLLLANEKMPCEYVQDTLITNLSYYGIDHTPDFLKCISKTRVCVVADNRVVSSESIKKLTSRPEISTLVIVQSKADDDMPLCLIGNYSGGSAAAWSFSAYKIVANEAIPFKGMHKAYAQGEAIDPKSAALMTYKMYEKFAHK